MTARIEVRKTYKLYIGGAFPRSESARTYEVRTYGCQMNVHDSERLSGLLEEAGYSRPADGEQHGGQCDCKT